MASSLFVAQAPESSQKVHLHPLVLLTASDLITRHILRKLEGPIVGLLLGQQQGTTVTAEYAFTAKTKDGLLDHTDDWTNTRVSQYKEVHKNPALEVVGWFTLCPEEGPLPQHAPLHKQLLNLYAENAIMLAIHATEFRAVEGGRGKLPLSIYESVDEAESVANGGAMQVDGNETAGMRFRTVPFAIETEESEMIAINYVAKGAGSAAAITPTAMSSKAEETPSKAGEGEQATGEPTPLAQASALTPDEEDQIAGMTTRLNSVKMLQERLQLVSKMVESVPASYMLDQTVGFSPSNPNPEHTAQFRNIQALLSRLSLLTPAGQGGSEALKKANQAQSNDVALTTILSVLGQEAQGLSELGRKFAIVEQSKSVKSKNKGGFNSSAFGSIDEFGGRPGGMNESGLLMM